MTARHPHFGVRAAQRWASSALLAGVIDGTMRMARDSHEKRTKFEAAPAASLAGHVGPCV